MTPLLLLPPPSGSSYQQRQTRKFRKILSLALLGVAITLSVFSVHSYQEQEILASITLSELQESPLRGSFSPEELVFERNRTVVNLMIHGLEPGKLQRLQTPLSELGYGFHIARSTQDSKDVLELRVDHQKRQEFLSKVALEFGQAAQEESIDYRSGDWVYTAPQGAVMFHNQLLQRELKRFERDLERADEQSVLKLNLTLEQKSLAEDVQLRSAYEELMSITETPLLVKSGEHEEVIDLKLKPEWITIDLSGIQINRELVEQWANTLAQKLSRPTSTVHIVGTEEVRYKAHQAQVEGEFIEGVRMNPEEMTTQVIDALLDPALTEVQLRQYEIPVKVMNDITGEEMDLISVGYSEFSTGNAANRVHNIETGLKRINHSYIQPGEELSFNRLNGPINSEFRIGYAIFGSGSGESLGGGICQVSTTFYRALLNLGVPITMRQNHSWDLSYYQSGGYGLDATIFPSVGLDVKAKNDIDSPLFLYTYTRPETQEAFVLVYGKADGRKVTLEPEQEYIPWYGAKTLKWTQTVEMPDGEVKKNQIVSRYRR